MVFGIVLAETTLVSFNFKHLRVLKPWRKKAAQPLVRINPAHRVRQGSVRTQSALRICSATADGGRAPSRSAISVPAPRRLTRRSPWLVRHKHMSHLAGSRCNLCRGRVFTLTPNHNRRRYCHTDSLGKRCSREGRNWSPGSLRKPKNPTKSMFGKSGSGRGI